MSCGSDALRTILSFSNSARMTDCSLGGSVGGVRYEAALRKLPKPIENVDAVSRRCPG